MTGVKGNFRSWLLFEQAHHPGKSSEHERVRLLTESDAVLIARVLDGHREDFRLLVERHRARCFRYAFRMLGNREDAQDVFQDTLVRGFRRLATCRDRNRFGAWLFQILVNRCRSFAAGRRNRERTIVSGWDSTLEQVPGVRTLDVESQLEIHAALQMLSGTAREAFLLKHIEGLSYAEMAAITGAGVSALKMRVSRARSRLRRQLQMFRNGF